MTNRANYGFFGLSGPLLVHWRPMSSSDFGESICGTGPMYSRLLRISFVQTLNCLSCSVRVSSSHRSRWQEGEWGSNEEVLERDNEIRWRGKVATVPREQTLAGHRGG